MKPKCETESSAEIDSISNIASLRGPVITSGSTPSSQTEGDTGINDNEVINYVFELKSKNLTGLKAKSHRTK